MSHKIFISYASQDHELAESFKSKIEELFQTTDKETVDIFDVRTNVKAGEDIRQSIKVAIEEARTVVVISSENADASPWVNYEAGLADAMGKNIVFLSEKGGEDAALLRRFVDTAKIIKIENG